MIVPAVDADALALVPELRVVAHRASDARELAGRRALPRRLLDHRLADADRKSVRIGGARRLNDQAIALAVRVRAEELLAVRKLEIEEDVVRHHGRTLREVVVPLAILLRPGLVEVGHRRAGGLGAGELRHVRAEREEACGGDQRGTCASVHRNLPLRDWMAFLVTAER